MLRHDRETRAIEDYNLRVYYILVALLIIVSAFNPFVGVAGIVATLLVGPICNIIYGHFSNRMHAVSLYLNNTIDPYDPVDGLVHDEAMHGVFDWTFLVILSVIAILLYILSLTVLPSLAGVASLIMGPVGAFVFGVTLFWWAVSSHTKLKHLDQIAEHHKPIVLMPELNDYDAIFKCDYEKDFNDALSDDYMFKYPIRMDQKEYRGLQSFYGLEDAPNVAYEQYLTTMDMLAWLCASAAAFGCCALSLIASSCLPLTIITLVFLAVATLIKGLQLFGVDEVMANHHTQSIAP